MISPMFFYKAYIKIFMIYKYRLTFSFKTCRLYIKVDRGAVNNSNRTEAAANEVGERRYRRRILSGMADFWDMMITRHILQLTKSEQSRYRSTEKHLRFLLHR